MGHAVAENLERLWANWKRVARKIGTFQARILLTILYALVVLPFGITVRLLADPLRIKKRPTAWQERPDSEFDLDWARRQ
jgi:hypothetical protein